MITKNSLIDDFKKCPSVYRKGKTFLHSSEHKIWIVENPFCKNSWFFEKEKYCPIRFKCVSVVSRVYFRSAIIAKKWFLEGNEVPW